MRINNTLAISDLHSGCQLSLCPPRGVKMSEAVGRYVPGPIVRKMYHRVWRPFWDEWVPTVTKGEKSAIVLNGDVVDGFHHNNKSHWSANMNDQRNCAYELLEPEIEKYVAHDDEGNRLLFFVGGTEVHDGPSKIDAEILAEKLKAQPDSGGNYCRYELFLDLDGALAHFMHHIGTTSSSQHEAAAINAELTRELESAARWGETAPHFVVRSHRHRYGKVVLPARMAGKRHAEAVAFTTPAWQLKTPYTYRIAGARVSPPQMGGAIIRIGDEDAYVRNFTRVLSRAESVETVKI